LGTSPVSDVAISLYSDAFVKERTLEILMTSMTFMAAWVITLTATGGTKLFAGAALHTSYTSRHGNSWHMPSTLSFFHLSLRVIPPFGTQTPFQLCKLVTAD
jgi:hypothetical protein